MAQKAGEGRYGITRKLYLKLKNMVGLSPESIGGGLTIANSKIMVDVGTGLEIGSNGKLNAIASGGGGFIDTSNVITSGTFTTSLSYTATADCFIVFKLAAVASGAGANAYLNGELIAAVYSSASGVHANTFCIPLKTGDVFTASNTYVDDPMAYKVYGVH